jgi:hypothetical protein
VLAEGPQTFEQIRDRLKRDLPGTNERALGFAVRMLLPLVQVPEDDAPWAFVGNPRFALADERFVAKSHRPRVFLPGLRIAATVLVDGFVAGTWRSDRKKGVATLTVAPFAPFPARVRRDVSAEAEALLRFAEPDARSYEVRVGK